MPRTSVALAVGAVALLVATAVAAAGSGSGVRVAKDGVGAYVGNHFNSTPRYVVAALAASPTLLEISMHPWTTCYPSYESLNGKKVKLSPAQQKSFAEGHGWDIPIPNVALSSSGSFRKSEIVRGPNGSRPTISGRVRGNRVSGTFSATGIVNNGGYHCDDVSFTWTATFNATARPDPIIFRSHP